MRVQLLGVMTVMLCLGGTVSLAQTATMAPAPAGGPTPTGEPAPSAGTAKAAVFTQEQLDQMLAPIALYPDALLAQVLMATTYPGEVAEAVTWSKANSTLKGDEAVKQVAGQTWDPSVQALVAFPQVLVTLGQDPVWVQRLGDAFLAQPDDVMNSVQRLRRQAQAAGNLQSNQYQNVTVQAAPAPSSAGATTQSAPAGNTIIIEPADPQVVYVPSYNPNTTYGTWQYPASPPVYYPPPPAYYAGSALVAGLAFGTGVAIINSLWGDCDWDDHDIDIDVDRYNNINNIDNRINNSQNKWQHNAVHRDGVPYRDARSREQYGRQLDGARQRAAYRGDDAQRAQAREKARASMDRHGIERPATTNREARERVREAQAGNRLQGGANAPRVADRRQGDGQLRQAAQKRPTASAGRARNNAFDGVRSPSRANVQANRGRLSQSFAQRPSSARAAGRPVSRPASAPMRRGGGRR